MQGRALNSTGWLVVLCVQVIRVLVRLWKENSAPIHHGQATCSSGDCASMTSKINLTCKTQTFLIDGGRLYHCDELGWYPSGTG